MDLAVALIRGREQAEAINYLLGLELREKQLELHRWAETDVIRSIRGQRDIDLLEQAIRDPKIAMAFFESSLGASRFNGPSSYAYRVDYKEQALIGLACLQAISFLKSSISTA